MNSEEPESFVPQSACQNLLASLFVECCQFPSCLSLSSFQTFKSFNRFALFKTLKS